MKSIKTILLSGAVIAAAFALSVAPSEAAKKAAKCSSKPGLCSTNCKGGSCELRNCDANGALTSPIFSSKVCKLPDCPTKC